MTSHVHVRYTLPTPAYNKDIGDDLPACHNVILHAPLIGDEQIVAHPNFENKEMDSFVSDLFSKSQHFYNSLDNM